MFDEVLFEKTRALTGGFFTGGVSEEAIKRLEEELGTNLPVSYIEFLKRFGSGGLSGSYTKGIEDKDFFSVLILTVKFREDAKIDTRSVAIAKVKNEDEEGYIYLDTSKYDNGECPVYKYNKNTQQITYLHKNFYDYFNRKTEELLEEELTYLTPEEIKEVSNLFDLPRGVGYKSAWMVLKKASLEELKKVLPIKAIEEVNFDKGLQAMHGKEGLEMLLIWESSQNTYYVLGDRIMDYTYEEDLFLDLIKMIPEVYLFYTHRVTEAHGFVRAVNGIINRCYYYDEDRIVSIGCRTKEEQACNIDLPNDFDEMWDKKTLTRMNEDVVMEMAIQWTGQLSSSYQYSRAYLGYY